MFVLNPAGPVHTVFTVTGISTAGLNLTVQVRVILDPIGQIGLGMLLITVTEDGAGTILCNKLIILNHNRHSIHVIIILKAL